MNVDLALPCSQQVFADLVGITQPRVAMLLADGVLPAGGTAGQWLQAYCGRLREQAAGRAQELSAERAALARSQRVAQDLKNAVALGQYAPIGLLTDILAAASASIASRMDAMPGELRTAWPDMSDDHIEAVTRAMTRARNEWVRETAELVDKRVDELCGEDESDPLPDLDDDPISGDTAA